MNFLKTLKLQSENCGVSTNTNWIALSGERIDSSLQIFGKLICRKKTLLLLTVFIICIAGGCKEKSNHKENINSIERDSINLYLTYTDLNQFLPDTVFEMSHLNSTQNLGKKQQIFDSILESRRQADTSLRNLVLLRNAKLKFIDFANIYRYKYLNSQKDNIKLSLFQFYTPFDVNRTADQWLTLLNELPAETRNSKTGITVKSKLQKYLFEENLGKSLRIFINQFHDTIKLQESSYYILVTGASWCKPCIEEERVLKYFYHQIDPKILNIIGISLDTDPEKWENYINSEKLPWQTFVVPNSFDNATINELKLESIPMNFLLDKDFKIIKQNTDIRKLLSSIKEIPFRI